MPDDGLSPERVIRALARPGLGDELHALGVRDLSTFGGPDVYIPPQRESWVRQLIDQEFANERAAMRQPIEAPPATDDLLGGLPYLKADYEAAGRLHVKNKMTIQGIEKKRELRRKRAYRIYRQFKAGAVVYDDVGLRPGSGYRWDPVELDKEPPEYKLIRG
jgi:hypothetical protein